jgi:hypothetical protein
LIQNENPYNRKKDEDFDLHGINKGTHLSFNGPMIPKRSTSSTFARDGEIDTPDFKRMSVEETVLQTDVVEKL